ncbi:hypothetical protein [Serratia fonticola]|uniref:hypothetical protein n=1 Tax=Serratia fonticola TaxID=47917 RepID=UPI000BA2823A|nr:hypothetical protein [Serratia fonticola]PAA95167.1 hypothetical protein CJJ13_23640 [Serratia fonticola]
MIQVSSTEKNIEGLESYLTNGYVEANSFNDPEDDALECLSDLLVKDLGCCLSFCKKILNSNNIDGVFIKGSALNFLLLSEQWPYAFEYLTANAGNITVAELEKALFYFYCAKNETDPYPVPEGLFKKLMERYEELKDDPDAKFYHLHETYNDFSKAYSLNN